MDGTKVLANASRHSAVSHGHAQGQMQLLEEQFAQLLAKAEQADSAPLEDGLSVPEEVARRKDRLGKLREATAQIEARARERHRGEMAEFEQKVARREAQRAAGSQPRGREPKRPVEGPRSKGQYNFTDPQSRIMKSGSGFEQSYNAQAGVEVQSRLIVSKGVSDAPNDKEQMEPGVAAASPVIESIAAVLIDSGFYSEKAVAAVEMGDGAKPGCVKKSAKLFHAAGPKVYAATGRQHHGRSIEPLEKRADPPKPEPGASAIEVMQHRLSTKAGRALYALRKQTVEPVFGIIKAAMGFRRFSLRGLEKVRTEWTLVALSYNLKRLFHLGARLQAA